MGEKEEEEIARKLLIWRDFTRISLFSILCWLQTFQLGAEDEMNSTDMDTTLVEGYQFKEKIQFSEANTESFYRENISQDICHC